MLVIEDDLESGVALAALLEVWGHEARVRAEPSRAIAEASVWQPEAVILDLGLPETDGCEVARQVRCLPAGDDCFIIALTGFASPDDRRRALQAGCDRFLAKPTDLDELRTLLSNARDPSTGRRREERQS